MDPDPEAIRATYRANFDELNRRLASTKLDRFVRFFNFGYVPLDGETARGPRLSRAFPNPDSAQLLFQLVADLDVTDRQVVEVGCGRGGNLALLRDLLHAGTVVGVDLAHPSLTFAAGIAGPPGGFVQGDAEQLPLADGSADVVLNVESAGCYPQVDRFYREVHRVLRPDGWFLYADVMPATMVDRYEALLVSLGFVVDDRRDITPNVLAARAQRADREREALGQDPNGPLAEWVGQSGSALHTALSDGSVTYVLLRMRRSDRSPAAGAEFSADEIRSIRQSSAHWADVLRLSSTAEA